MLQRFLAHGVAEAFAQQAVEDLGADLLAEALLDDLGRHLARTEALDLGATRDLAQAAVDHALEAIRREAEGHAAFEVTERFDRNLHIHSCNRGIGRGTMLMISDAAGARMTPAPWERGSFADYRAVRQRPEAQAGDGGAKGGTRTRTPCGTGT